MVDELLDAFKTMHRLINIRTASKAYFRLFCSVYLVAILFGQGITAQGEEEPYCEDTISGFRWPKNGTCNIINELPRPYDYRMAIKPEFSRLSHIKQLKFNLKGLRTYNQLPVELSLLDVVEFSIGFGSSFDGGYGGGTLPAQFSTWTNLEKFQLQTAYPTFGIWYFRRRNSSLPAQFSEWRNLKVFELSYHQINGTIPVQLSTWTKLQSFEIKIAVEKTSDAENFIRGTLPPQFSQWTDLRRFKIGSGELSGRLPIQYSTWQNITGVTLASNKLSGGLPIQYSTWQNITGVTLARNKLVGGVPKQYSTWKLISTLQLSDQFGNSLCVSDSLLRYSFFLEISHTDIGQYRYGQLPVCISYPKVSEILLQFKNSSSSQPKEVFHNWEGSEPCFWNGIICRNSQISEIQINTGISAKIPPEFSLISNLTVINLGNAGITGSIPAELSVLRIEQFDISNHSIKQAALPAELSTWSDIILFDVSTYAGQMTGSLPDQYSTWKAMEHFNIENNEFSGTLPVYFSTWIRKKSLRKLDYIYVVFSNNLLSGTVPEQYSAWKEERRWMGPRSTIDLAPQYQDKLCITSFTGVSLNDIFENSDVEDLPNCFPFKKNRTLETEALQQYRDFVYLPPYRLRDWQGDSVCEETQWDAIQCFNGSVYSLGHRQWRGTASLQPQLSSLQNLHKIEFPGLQFSGSIPPELSNLLYMREFNLLYTPVSELFQNNGSRSLPIELSMWKYIQSFNLNNRLFMGKLPVEYSTWERMQLFDVGNNKISGLLPEQYSTWQNLQYFNVSNNTLSGKLPKEYSSWKNLVQFNISNNDLPGTIHKQYSIWNKLLVFDIKNSSLFGTLPSQFSSWKYASYIDTSYNNFTGQIPKEFGALNLSTLSLFPQVNNEIFLIPQNDPDFCVSQYLRGFLANNISFNLENTREQNYCDDILLEIGNVLYSFQNLLVQQNVRELCDFKQVDCFYPPKRFSFSRADDPTTLSFELYFSSDVKVSVSFDFNILYNIQELFNYNANITNTYPLQIPIIDSDTVLETLILFKNQINESFFQNNNNNDNNLLHNDYFFYDDWIGNDPCSFRGIECNFETKQIISIRTDYGITLSGTRISIPPEFSNFKYLQELVLEDLIITGTIPVELSELEYLQEFVIHGEVNGSLPVQFSKWRYLKTFKIIPPYGSRSYVTGTLPEQFSTWINLDYFYISGSSLSGSLPKQFSTWSNRFLTVQIFDNKLTGTLPADFSAWTDIITEFNVSGNFLSGSLPKQYSNWTINDFSVANNQLNGTLPVEFSIWSLDVFDASQNFLSGSLPQQYSTWGNESYSFVVRLFDNQFIGQLPSDFSEWSSLKEFDISRNFLSGSLPIQYSVWSSTLNVKRFSNQVQVILQQFNGNVCISNSLKTFFLPKHRNSDVSQLPICSEQEIYEIEMEALSAFRNSSQNQNQFDSWKGNNACVFWAGIECFNGRVISVKFNAQLPAETSIPPEFSELKYLRRIDFHDQLITGTLPPELSVLTNMQYFNLGNHELSGTLPVELSVWSNLKQILLGVSFSEGLLTGPLPEQYSTWQILYRLELFGNLLTGTLPVQLSEWSCGYILLSDNSFSGTVPVQYSTWKRMKYLSGENQIQLDLRNNDQLCILPTTYNYLNQFEEEGLFNLPKCDDVNYEYPSSQVRSQLNLVRSILEEEDWGQGNDVCNNWTYVDCYNGTLTSIANSPLPITYYDWNERFEVPAQISQVSIPPEISLFKNIVSLGFGSVTGNLPPELSVLEFLEYFEIVVDSNVSLSLPVEYSNWKNIRYFRASRVSGLIPEQYSVWRNLRVFDVGGNDLSGTLPPQFSTWAYKLANLDVWAEYLTKSVTEQYSTWQNLEFLRLPENFCFTAGLLNYFQEDIGANIVPGIIPPYRFYEEEFGIC